MRRFWKEHSPRKGVSGVVAFVRVSASPGGALCAAGLLYSESGVGGGPSSWRSVPLRRGADRSSERDTVDLGPGDAALRRLRRPCGFPEACVSEVVERH